MPRTHRLTRAASSIAAAFTASLALAQADPPAVRQTEPQIETDPAALPDADDILARYVEAIGGRDKLDAMKTRRHVGRFNGPPFEFQASLTTHFEAPNKLHMRFVEPLGLRVDLAYDGERAWQRVDNGDPVDLTGTPSELELVEDAAILGDADYAERYSLLETAALAQTPDGPRLAVRAVSALTGRERVLVFDQTSGLLVGIRVATAGPTGEPRFMDVRLESYREFDGLRFPTKITQRFDDDPAPRVFEYDRVEINHGDEHDFSPPGGLPPRPEAPAE